MDYLKKIEQGQTQLYETYTENAVEDKEPINDNQNLPESCDQEEDHEQGDFGSEEHASSDNSKHSNYHTNSTELLQCRSIWRNSPFLSNQTMSPSPQCASSSQQSNEQTNYNSLEEDQQHRPQDEQQQQPQDEQQQQEQPQDEQQHGQQEQELEMQEEQKYELEEGQIQAQQEPQNHIQQQQQVQEEGQNTRQLTPAQIQNKATKNLFRDQFSVLINPLKNNNDDGLNLQCLPDEMKDEYYAYMTSVCQNTSKSRSLYQTRSFTIKFYKEIARVLQKQDDENYQYAYVLSELLRLNKQYFLRKIRTSEDKELNEKCFERFYKKNNLN